MARTEIAGKKSSMPTELPATLHDDQILNFKQAATFWGVSLATMRRLHSAGKLPTIQISERRLGVRVADLKAVRVAQMKRPPAAA